MRSATGQSGTDLDLLDELEERMKRLRIESSSNSPDLVIHGNAYQGYAVNVPDCEGGATPAGMGACCLGDGTCEYVTPGQCFLDGGTFVGGLCEDAICTGACCNGDVCTPDTTRDECESGFGTWQGPGTDCDPNPCPSLGACCHGGICSETSHVDCDFLSGIWFGTEVSCADIDDCGCECFADSAKYAITFDWTFSFAFDGNVDCPAFSCSGSLSGDTVTSGCVPFDPTGWSKGGTSHPMCGPCASSGGSGGFSMFRSFGVNYVNGWVDWSVVFGDDCDCVANGGDEGPDVWQEIDDPCNADGTYTFTFTHPLSGGLTYSWTVNVTLTRICGCSSCCSCDGCTAALDEDTCSDLGGTFHEGADCAHACPRGRCCMYDLDGNLDSCSIGTESECQVACCSPGCDGFTPVWTEGILTCVDEDTCPPTL